MTEALQAFHFLRPAFLLGLPLALALVWWLSKRHAQSGNWQQLMDAELISALRLEPGATASASAPWPWLGLALSVALLALAGPSWQRDASRGFRAPAAWVVLLDLSPSMAASDLAPNRITRARYALDDLLGSARDARVALVAFSEEAFTVSPLTDDVATLRALLPPLVPEIMPTEGDLLAPALQQAGKLLLASGARDQRVIVLSDGFEDPVASFAAIAQLKARGVQLSVVAVGTAGGAPLAGEDGRFAQNAQGQTALTKLDAAGLQQLASAGAGDYQTLAELPALSRRLQAARAPASIGDTDADALKELKVSHWRDGGVWLMPLLLLLTALLGRRGWL